MDAEAFADWGIDFLKYDNCWAPASDWVIDRYTAMSHALNKTGRPIVYSMCDWGVGDPWLWAPKVGSSQQAVSFSNKLGENQKISFRAAQAEVACRDVARIGVVLL